VVIKASAASEIRVLIDALISTPPASPARAADGTGADDVHREAAIARLAIIGSRAVERLLDAYAKTTDRRSRIAILRALEAIGDRRSAGLATSALKAGGDVAVAATGVLRSLLTSTEDGVSAGALDVLMTTALDRALEQRVRVAAFEALQDLPADVRARVADVVKQDSTGANTDVLRTAGTDTAGGDAMWADAVEGRLPEHPKPLRDALAGRAPTATLTAMQKIIDAVRTQEREASPSRREGWLSLRGALHQALAQRGSRIALYDLRETLDESSHPLPISFLTALHVLGDASCLEPIAAAWSRAGAADDRWRHQLADAFHAIVRREKVTRRHAAMKRIAARWPEATALIERQ
jgi:hypothetical protein